jgi:O-antigen/teichoic acid export membrane protein
VVDGIWVASGQIGVALGVLVGTRALTQLLPPAVFGSVSLLIGVSMLGATLVCQPLLHSLVRFYPETVSLAHVPFLRRAIVVPMRLGVLIFAAVVLIGGGVYSDSVGLPYLPFVALAGLVLLDAARNLETTFLSAARRQRSGALWLAADTWSRMLFSVLAVVLLGPSAQSVLLGYFAGTLVVLVIARLRVRREGTSFSGPSETDVALLLRSQIRHYAIPLVPLAVVGWITALSDRYIVAGALGLREAGLYAAAYGLLNRPVLIGASIFLTTLRPVYFDLLASGDMVKAKRVMRLWLLALSFALGLGITFVSFGRAFLTRLMLGPQYQSTSDLLPLMALGFSLLALSQVFNTISLAQKRTWSVSFSELAGATASIAAAVPLTLRYGIRGTALAVPLYYGVQLLVAWWLATRVRDVAVVPPILNRD